MTPDLSTTYLGLPLPHPFMPGASPLVDDLDTVRRLEDGGAAAIVMRSLFEEQLQAEHRIHGLLETPDESFAEALSYLPSQEFALGPEEYLEQLRRITEAVEVPVIASLNGTTRGGWLEYSRLMQEAGASALELNLYRLATDPGESSQEIEERSLEMVQAVKAGLLIPLAVKLSPFYTALARFAQCLDEAGADGLVIFNRFYQADIDVAALEVDRVLHLSTSSELLLRLRWLAILSGQVGCDLGVTGGVHTATDAVKAVLCGAHAVQTVSALLEHGPQYLGTLRQGLTAWMEELEYESLNQMRGSMSLARCPDPQAYERTQYINVLQSFKVGV